MSKAKEATSTSVTVKHYQVLVDAILGSSAGDAEALPHQYAHIKGQVSEPDLKAAGCDVAWLLKTNQIVELGYAPA